MKIRFESNYDLPFGKTLSIPVFEITGFGFQEDSKYYS